MQIPPRIVDARPVPPTRVWVRFANGEQGTFDVSPYLQYPAFAPLRDPGLFRKAHAENGTVVWNEEIDLDPDTVWDKAVREDPKEQTTLN